jgi:hypothetical protein
VRKNGRAPGSILKLGVIHVVKTVRDLRVTRGGRAIGFIQLARCDDLRKLPVIESP